MEAKTKLQSQGEAQEQQKVNSISIAKQLINGPIDSIGIHLLDFKNIKNQNYDKFSDRIAENLNDSDADWAGSFKLFMDISREASPDNTTGHQMGCILEGFLRYWRKSKLSKPELRNLFDFIDGVYPQIAKNYINVCSELIRSNCQEGVKQFKKNAFELVRRYFKGSQYELDKVLPVIHEFGLYEELEAAKVVEAAMWAGNANEIVYIFKAGDKLRQQILQLYIEKCCSRGDLKKCETVIKVLGLNPHHYHNVIGKMIEKYMHYQLRTFKLYFIELVVSHDSNLLKALVRQLKRDHREREAKYFIVKYHLEKEFSDIIGQKQSESLSKMRNILIDNDRFGPTQSFVLQQEDAQSKRYLTLADLNFTEKDVSFIDESNIDSLNVASAFASSKVGLDSQATGGVHVFDHSKIAILQIFSGGHFYIFDFMALLQNEKFKEVIKHIFEKCRIYGHDHQKQVTSIQKALKLDIAEKVMQELQRDRILDTNKYFKKVYPKETRSNLIYITEFIIKRNISKYEQCSGWQCRPLRKAQLHYAALDCVLPLLLGQGLEQMQQSKK